MMLYKYKNLSDMQSLKYAIDSLENKYLYFSRPSEVNDPFDCQIQVDANAKGLDFKVWVREMLKESKIDKALLTIGETTKRFKDPRVQKTLKLLTESMVEGNHLLSLSADCENESMWALYAGNYNGICIGYKLDDSSYSFLPKKIEFTNENGSKFVPPDNHEIEFKKIKYDNNGNHVMKLFSSRTSQIKGIVHNLRHKKKCWNSEKEYRAIIHDSDYEVLNLENKTVKVFYEDRLLEEITFGYKTEKAIMNVIIQMVKRKYKNRIKFYRLEPDLRKYCLVKKEI